eukprot:ANDGO_04974.mRNA.1 hypothetical protein
MSSSNQDALSRHISHLAATNSSALSLSLDHRSIPASLFAVSHGHPSLLSQLPGIKILSMQHCDLRSVPAIHNVYPLLHSLDLRSNDALSDISNLSHLPRLQSLWIDNQANIQEALLLCPNLRSINGKPLAQASSSSSSSSSSAGKAASMNADPFLEQKEASIRASGGSVANAEVLQLLSDVRGAYASRIHALQSELLRAEKETAELLEAAETLEKETALFANSRAEMETRHEAEKRAALEENASLRAENQRLLARLKQVTLASSSPVSGHSYSSSASAAGAGSGPTAAAGSGGNAMGSPLRRPMSAHNSGNASSNPGSTTTTPVYGGSGKALSLRQLHELMDEIYASKAKADQKAISMHLPLETMEQHVASFLSTRYGLRPIVAEHASALAAAVARFSADDPDVAVFRKILRCEIDDEFRHVQTQLKATVKELVRVHLQGKHPLKRDDEISHLVEKRVGGVLAEDEWVDVVRYMYNQDDVVGIMMAVRPFLISPSSNGHVSAGASGKNKVRYADLVRVLLEFQMRGHERFLRRFVMLWREADQDQDGVVSRDELRRLVRNCRDVAGSLDRSPAQIEAVVVAADPWGHSKITFSECVRVLAHELVAMATIQHNPADPQAQLAAENIAADD